MSTDNMPGMEIGVISGVGAEDMRGLGPTLPSPEDPARMAELRALLGQEAGSQVGY